jgi:CHAD domain-containing protein
MAPPREIRGLACDEPFRTAAGKVIWTRFSEMMSFGDVALAGKDIEGVHDMRVGSRRLRAALELFRDVFPRKQLAPMLAEVKRLADSLGEVRDLDVMIERLRDDIKDRPRSQALVLREMLSEAREKRELCREELKETIERLEREDFPRRFSAFVAKSTT